MKQILLYWLITLQDLLVKENAYTTMQDKVTEAVKKTNLLYLNNDADVSSSDCPMFHVKNIRGKAKSTGKRQFC